MNRPGFSTLQSMFIGLAIAAGALFVIGSRAARAPMPSDGDVAVTTEPAPTTDAGVAGGDVAQPATALTPAPEPEEPPLKIVVSTGRRVLYLIEGRDTVMKARVAIGMNAGFEYQGRKYHFATPKGRRTIIAKSPDPVWTVPEWHYYERAAKHDMEVAKLAWGDTIELADGTFLVAHDKAIGRINQFGNFAEFPAGVEIMFDGKVYIPPLDSRLRRVPDALGPYKLDMGDGYLIHGTHYYNEDSIGDAVSHGCVRMDNDDVTRLYKLVPRGTVVEII